MIPADIWPCAFLLSRLVDGQLGHRIGAFLIQADSHAAAQQKAQDFADQLAARTGYGSAWVCVNTYSGSQAVIDLEAGPVRSAPTDRAAITVRGDG